MSKQAERFGLAVAKVLCCIGETINTSFISKGKIDFKKRFIDNDREAIQQDWNIVGDEVRISLENYGKEHPQGKLFTTQSIIRKLISLELFNKGYTVLQCFEQYFDGSWKYGTAKVLKIKNDWFLHLAVTKEMPAFNNDVVKHVVGIDRGLRVLAATYDECGNANFFDGKKVMARRNNYKRLRAELQAKGTKSAKRKLKNISGRENRWMTDVNHSITKTLVERYGHNTLFVVEDLTDIRFNSNELGKSLRSAVNSWAFRQFEQFLSYKASCNQSEVIRVSPRYTSQRCPKCGVIDKINRNHKLHEYHYKDCLYRSNDDRVAAMNIQELGKRYLSGENKPKFKK